MKKYNYGCDAGSLLVGNKDCLVLLDNGYGDGGFNVFIAEKGDTIPKEFKFVTVIKGLNINLYNYDCLEYDELDNNIICTLTGRYGVYNHDGDILIEKWAD